MRLRYDLFFFIIQYSSMYTILYRILVDEQMNTAFVTYQLIYTYIYELWAYLFMFDTLNFVYRYFFFVLSNDENRNNHLFLQDSSVFFVRKQSLSLHNFT